MRKYLRIVLPDNGNSSDSDGRLAGSTCAQNDRDGANAYADDAGVGHANADEPASDAVRLDT